MKLKILAMVCALSMSLTATAQKKKTKAKKPVATVVDTNPGLKIYKSMVPSTAKLMFIDSVVVDKKNFLAHVPLNPEAGKISMRDSVHSQYVNEFADRWLFSHGDSTSTMLYSADKLGGRWASPSVILAGAENIKSANFPFLMADGITLYFAAKGEESMGGYDIFMTTFDQDNGTYYTPENIGLPYNSTANDYLLAIDEIDNLGWLVTDRRQPHDKVCIYTFVPTASRHGFEDDDLTDSQIERYSKILSIADTWKFGKRKAALAKVEELKKRIASKKPRMISGSRFIVNDNCVYSSADDFKSAAAKEMYLDWLQKKQTFDDTAAKLDEARMEYHNAANKSSVAYKVRTLENQQQTLYSEMNILEKKIRITELNNH